MLHMSNFDQIVLQALQDRRGDWQEVARASGVSYSWLSKFANGHIGNPGYGTLCRLHEALIPSAARSSAATESAANHAA